MSLACTHSVETIGNHIEVENPAKETGKGASKEVEASGLRRQRKESLMSWGKVSSLLVK